MSSINNENIRAGVSTPSFSKVNKDLTRLSTSIRPLERPLAANELISGGRTLSASRGSRLNSSTLHTHFKPQPRMKSSLGPGGPSSRGQGTPRKDLLLTRPSSDPSVESATGDQAVLNKMINEQQKSLTLTPRSGKAVSVDLPRFGESSMPPVTTSTRPLKRTEGLVVRPRPSIQSAIINRKPRMSFGTSVTPAPRKTPKKPSSTSAIPVSSLRGGGIKPITTSSAVQNRTNTPSNICTSDTVTPLRPTSLTGAVGSIYWRTSQDQKLSPSRPANTVKKIMPSPFIARSSTPLREPREHKKVRAKITPLPDISSSLRQFSEVSAGYHPKEVAPIQSVSRKEGGIKQQEELEDEQANTSWSTVASHRQSLASHMEPAAELDQSQINREDASSSNRHSKTELSLSTSSPLRSLQGVENLFGSPGALLHTPNIHQQRNSEVVLEGMDSPPFATMTADLSMWGELHCSQNPSEEILKMSLQSAKKSGGAMEYDFDPDCSNVEEPTPAMNTFSTGLRQVNRSLQDQQTLQDEIQKMARSHKAELEVAEGRAAEQEIALRVKLGKSEADNIRDANLKNLKIQVLEGENQAAALRSTQLVYVVRAAALYTQLASMAAWEREIGRGDLEALGIIANSLEIWTRCSSS